MQQLCVLLMFFETDYPKFSNTHIMNLFVSICFLKDVVRLVTKTIKVIRVPIKLTFSSFHIQQQFKTVFRSKMAET